MKVKVPLRAGQRASVPTAMATSGVRRWPVAPIRTLVAPRGSPVATLGDVTMSGADGGGSISGPLFTPLFDQTSDTIIWVETGDTFTRARQGELDLQNQGRTDPATHIDDNPIPPDLVVDGTLQYDGSRVTGELRIVDPRTGEVIARIPVDVDEGDWSKLMEQLARELARRLRERAATTSTTTSTTGTSVTSTTPTSSTTTFTQPGGTSTTLPAGGTCTSVIPASYCECGGLGGVCTSDADCQRRGGTTCVDHVGHTLVTYRLAGTGGLLGAIKIDGSEYGLWGPSPTAVLVRGGCGTNAFLQGSVPPLQLAETVCPTYYHPGAEITLQAWRSTSGVASAAGRWHLLRRRVHGLGRRGELCPAWVTATIRSADAARRPAPHRSRSWPTTRPRKTGTASRPRRPDRCTDTELARGVQGTIRRINGDRSTADRTSRWHATRSSGSSPSRSSAS